MSMSASTRYAVGLGVLWSWGDILHHTSAVLSEGAVTGELDWLWLCLIGVGVVCFAITSLTDRSFTAAVIEKRNVLLACALLASLATAAMPWVLAFPALDVLIGIVSELGTCVLFLAWGCAVFSLSKNEIRPALAKTAVVIAIVSIASQIVFDVVAYAADIVFPFLSALLLPKESADKMRSARVRFVPPKTIFISFKRFFLAVASFGMVFGCFRATLFSEPNPGPLDTSLIYFVGFGIGAVSLLLISRLSHPIDETDLFKAVLPLTVLALFMLMLSGPARTLGAPVLLGCGDAWFDTLRWMLMALAVERTRISPVLGFSMMLGISWAGAFFGFLLGAASVGGLLDWAIVLAPVAVCLVSSGMMMFGRIGILPLEFPTDQPDPVPAQPDRAEEVAAQPAASQPQPSLAERFGLTPRESEIAAYLLAGRSRGYIEEKLVLSKSTVKTHVRHIYEKTGVHSQQELLDLAEAMKKSR